MKALRVGVCLLIAFSGARGFASEPAADADRLLALLAFLRRSISTLDRPLRR